TNGAKIFANNAVITNSQGLGAFAEGGSEISIQNATYSTASGVSLGGNFLASQGSKMNCNGIDLTGISASIANFRVLSGSIMNCAGATGTASIAKNTVNVNGIVFS